MSPFWSSVHVALVSGGTEYEDGTVEAFQIGLGLDRFAFACIADGSGVIHQTTNVKGVMERDERGFPIHIIWDIDGAAWEWIPDPVPELLGLSGESLEEETSIPAYRASEGREKWTPKSGQRLSRSLPTAHRRAVRSGPRNLDSGLSEISIVFQAAVPKPVAPKYTTSGVRRPSEL